MKCECFIHTTELYRTWTKSDTDSISTKYGRLSVHRSRTCGKKIFDLCLALFDIVKSTKDLLCLLFLFSLENWKERELLVICHKYYYSHKMNFVENVVGLSKNFTPYSTKILSVSVNALSTNHLHFREILPYSGLWMT